MNKAVIAVDEYVRLEREPITLARVEECVDREIERTFVAQTVKRERP